MNKRISPISVKLANISGSRLSRKNALPYLIGLVLVSGCATQSPKRFGYASWTGEKSFEPVEVPESFVVQPREFFEEYGEYFPHSYFTKFYVDNRYIYVVLDFGSGFSSASSSARRDAVVVIDGSTGEAIKGSEVLDAARFQRLIRSEAEMVDVDAISFSPFTVREPWTHNESQPSGSGNGEAAPRRTTP